MPIPKNLTTEDVEEALKYIDKNGVPENNKSHKYMLEQSRKQYPPKYVLAVARHLATKETISTDGFNAIEAKDYLEKTLGFKIVSSSDTRKKLSKSSISATKKTKQKGKSGRSSMNDANQTPKTEECVLMNIMYSGDYVNEKRSSNENVGHEWINLHSDDNGKHYIYVTKTGKMDSSRCISTILLVRAISKKKSDNGNPVDNSVEVIAKAVNCQPIGSKSDESGNGGDLKWAIANKITYGNTTLDVIYSRNEFDGNREGQEAICATFWAKGGGIQGKTKRKDYFASLY